MTIGIWGRLGTFKMNGERIIFHIDMNCFFASCHQIIDPNLRNKAIAVGHNTKRGIIVTASYEARKFGVKAAMPIHCAKEKCPNLIIVNPTFGLYVKYATMLFDYLEKNFTKMIEVASIDECYLDVTDIYSQYQSVYAIAQAMQQGVYRDLGLPNSIGISTNKFLAKMASDMKKPMGITILRKEEIEKLLWPLPIEGMYGVGKSNALRLRKININTIGDLATCQASDALLAEFGKPFNTLVANAKGYGDNVVNVEHNQLKSINNELTLEDDIDNYEELKEYLLILARNLSFRAQRRLLKCKTVGIVIKYSKAYRHSAQHQLDKYTDDADIIYSQLLMIFDKTWNGQPIRLIGAFLGKIQDKYHLSEQLDIFGIEDEKSVSKANCLISDLNKKFKNNVFYNGEQIRERSYLNNSQTKYVESDRVKPNTPSYLHKHPNN